MQLRMEMQNKTSAFFIASLIFSFLVVISCGDKQEQSEKSQAVVKSESFTFFDIGINTKLTKKVGKELQKKLGRDAIERRSIIDLEINYRGFLKEHFPELNELNERLNFPPGERVEHNTVKLMYRYAQRRNVPFEYVELVFSDYTKTPILFKITFQKDEAGIVETLKTKYGQPEIIDWKKENGSSMFWKKNMDFLIASLVPDQFGQHEYQIVIYFAENLNQLADAEKIQKQKREEKRAQSGKTAF